MTTAAWAPSHASCGVNMEAGRVSGNLRTERPRPQEPSLPRIAARK